MSDKLKNLIIRALTGIVFVAIMVTSIINPLRLTCLFLIITGAAMWEYTGLVNKIDGVKVNRFISTVAGAYFFCAVTALQVNMVTGFIVFVPYVLTLIYLFVAELYLQNKNPMHSWAYTMLGQMYIAFPFSMMSVLAFQQKGYGMTTFDYLLPLSIFIFLWANDTGA